MHARKTNREPRNFVVGKKDVVAVQKDKAGRGVFGRANGPQSGRTNGRRPEQKEMVNDSGRGEGPLNGQY